MIIPETSEQELFNFDLFDRHSAEDRLIVLNILNELAEVENIDILKALWDKWTNGDDEPNIK